MSWLRNALRSLVVAAIILVLAALTAPSASADSMPYAPNSDNGQNMVVGVFHCHTTYSDGIYTVEEAARLAKSHGAKFLVVTDHFEDINLDEEEFCQVGNPLSKAMLKMRRLPKQSGILNYINACWAATEVTGILVVPGIEVGIGTDRDKVFDPAGEGVWDNKVHLLCVGLMTTDLASEIHAKLGQEGIRTFSREEKHIRLDDAQDSIARIAHEHGMATIIAHPYLNDLYHGFNYTLYKNRVNNIDGIEFFNGQEFGDEKSMEAMGFINRDAAMGPFRNLAVTSGCDFHGFPGVSDESLFDHQTILSLPSSWNSGRYEEQCQTIADALRGDGTCAAGIKQTATSGLTNPLGMLSDVGSALSGLALHSEMYQDGNRVFGGFDANIDDLDPNRPFYVHVPGVTIARINKDSIDNTAPPSEPPRVNAITDPEEALWIFMVDRSTSMKDRDKELIRQIADRLKDKGLPSDRCMVVMFSGTGNIAGSDIASDKRQIAGNLVNGEIPIDDGTAILDALMTMMLVADDKAPGRPMILLTITDGEEWSDGKIKDPEVITRELEKRGALCILALTDGARKTNDPIYKLLESDRVVRFSWEALEEGWQPSDISSYTLDGLKTIIVNNNSGDDLQVYLAWHDADGWHNRDWNSSWSIGAGRTNTRLLFDNKPFSADQVIYWAESTDGRTSWRGEKKNEVVNLADEPGESVRLNFGN